jgi:sigma-B regulation protein RsbU (phosphoserine phosphatase)
MGDHEMSLEEERLDLALKASNEGILDWDLQTGEIYYSNRLLGFLGYGRFGAPNILEEPEKHVHPEDLARLTRKLNRVLYRGGKLFADEARIRTNSGEWKWFRARALPLRDDDGTLMRLVGSLIDISKRRFAEKALAEERKMIDLILDRVPY